MDREYNAEIAMEYKEFQATVYIDYNIFNYRASFSTDETLDEYQSAICLYYTIKNLIGGNKKICIPYSLAHVQDLFQGIRFLDEKVNAIEEFTSGWFISEDEDDKERVRIDKCIN
jgi:hypothetical protein